VIEVYVAIVILYCMNVGTCCPSDHAIDGNTIPGDSVSTVEFYDPFAGRWQLASSMCTLRSRVGIAVFKGMYVFCWR